MPVMTEAPDAQKKRYKMKLFRDEFMSEWGGWLPAGSVIVVDEETAVRWKERGIADQAGRDEKTHAEIRHEKIRARLVPMDDGEVSDYDAAVKSGQRSVRSPMPTKQPVGRMPRRGRPVVPPQLVGAGVVNSLDDMPDDVTVSDEDED